MRTNEEFLDGIYGKRDALLKKRKKKMSVAATALCAVVCVAVGASAGLLGNRNEPNKVIEIYNSIMKSGSSVTESHMTYAEKEIVEDAEGEAPTDAESVEHATMADNYIKPAKPLPEATETTKAENGGMKDKGVTERLTLPAEDVAVDSEMGYAPETPDTGSDSVSPTAAQPENNPMPSTEEIIEAAYNAIPEEEREFVIKESAEATVTRYADGRQEYTVYFRTTQDKYMGIRLDSELNTTSFKGAD